MFVHPESRCFDLGNIGENQLEDHVLRHDFPVDAGKRIPRLQPFKEMIARIVIYLILVIVLSDLYIDMHYFRNGITSHGGNASCGGCPVPAWSSIPAHWLPSAVLPLPTLLG